MCSDREPNHRATGVCLKNAPTHHSLVKHTLQDFLSLKRLPPSIANRIVSSQGSPHFSPLQSSCVPEHLSQLQLFFAYPEVPPTVPLKIVCDLRSQVIKYLYSPPLHKKYVYGGTGDLLKINTKVSSLGR